MDERFAMTVSDVFFVGGRIVATGRIETGTVRIGDQVVISGGRSAEVAGIEIFRKRLTQASAGTTVGLTLAGIERGDIQAGDLLSDGAWPRPAAPLAPEGFEDPRFRQVEDEYRRLRAALDAGALSPEQFDAALSSMAFELHGTYWGLGANPAQWYAWTGGSWVQATPPERF